MPNSIHDHVPPAPVETFANYTLLLTQIAALRTEFVDLAFELDVRGSFEAADVAMTTAARLAELCEEFSAQGEAAPRTNLFPPLCPEPSVSFVESMKRPVGGFSPTNN
ncbi:hypothetical protein [Nibricoccus sp. IMCC34717]|uniref:hypothetical protein n=1 Tax=Nibricoccus sp. IMCC34717 TaxID=3034021 RepID=UPI00384CA993